MTGQDNAPQVPDKAAEAAAKKARRALYVMGGIDLAAIILFWLIKSFTGDLPLAFALLVVGLVGGAAYYIYQSHKLRPKDTP